MIDGNKYIEIVKIYFHFLVKEFEFKISEEIINGNFFYRLRYMNKVKAVTISYENMEDYLNVFISKFRLPDLSQI